MKFGKVPLTALLRLHNIVPTWINSHYTWGWYDAKLGEWTGASGKVTLLSCFMYCIHWYIDTKIEEDHIVLNVSHAAA